VGPQQIEKEVLTMGAIDEGNLERNSNEKAVRNSENDWDWKRMELRYDHLRGYLLCQSCWNGQHFSPSYRDGKGTAHARTPTCKGGGCHCGCRPEFQKRNLKFTHEGQMEISMENPLHIDK
jgi:hypothetical protein